MPDSRVTSPRVTKLAAQPYSALYEVGAVVGHWQAELGDGLSLGDVLAEVIGEDARKMLDCIPGTSISRSEFLGHWANDDEKLVRRGDVRYTGPHGDTVTFVDPLLTHQPDLKLSGSGGGGIPEFGSSEYAYAFFQTPYGLIGSPDRIQRLFTDVLADLLDGVESIVSYCSPQLQDYEAFKHGAVWWGMFLWVLHGPGARVRIVAAATTD